MKKNNIILIAVSGLAIILTFFALYQDKTTDYYLKIDDNKFTVSLADTNALRTRGLSNTQNLPQQTGLLFVFEDADIHGFWMKDMNYDIDIIWISTENEVVYIQHSATPESYPKVFSPNKQALYVLEVNSGEAKKSDIKIGDTIVFSRALQKRLSIN
jgi:uncharacterized membrane protein (UPF0127 family)